jgi:XTP/dITP diphosphohydrolase
MLRKLLFATNNKHKHQEIASILKNSINLLSLNDIGFVGEIPEDFDTLKQNAEQKAFYIFDKYKIDCFADDTGLEVEALNGKPGVYSARYSADELPNIPGEMRAEANMKKLLREMNGINNRNALFRTVICLVENGIPKYFEGKVDGVIIEKAKGNKGFGYDPIFIPNGYSVTFAEMNLEIKNKISHRSIATSKLVDYLLNQNI